MSDITSNLWAHYALTDEGSTFADDSGNAVDLAVTSVSGYPRLGVRNGVPMREFTRAFTSGSGAVASNYATNVGIDATLFQTLADGSFSVAFMAEFIPDQSTWSTGGMRVVNLISSAKTLFIYSLSPDGTLQVFWTGGSALIIKTFATLLPMTGLHHVTVVVEPGIALNAHAKLYIDGALIETTTDSLQPDTWIAGTGFVGSLRLSTNSSLFGQTGAYMRSLRIYARALAAADVEALYRAEVNAVAAINPEAVAVQAFGEYMLAQLPARVTAINLTRAAVVKAAFLGPYTVPSGGTFIITNTREGAVSVTVTPTTGSRTAAQLAVDINAALVAGGITTITATADADGRLVLSGAVPSGTTASVVVVGAGTLNNVMGWDTGGEYAVSMALVSPYLKHFRDGWPSRPPDADGGHFWLVVRDRFATPVDSTKHARNEYIVEFKAWVLCPEPMGDYRSRARIVDCVRAVREVLSPSAGRLLGRTTQSDVKLCQMLRAVVSAEPFQFHGGEGNFAEGLFDVAEISVGVRVFLENLT